MADNDEIIARSEIGRFEILKKLGEGAFGRVFLARDPQPREECDELVAIKMPHPHVFRDGAIQMRFLRELQTINSLKPHPGICRFVEAGMHQRSLFVVMEYVEGESLAARLKREAELSLRWTLELVRDLALVLAEVHEQNVVHRDLKPANIMLRTNGRPVIMDFGLARGDRSQELRLTSTGQILGTPYYMSPEVFSGNAAHAGSATDIYSLGVMLFQMLTGRRPFEAPTVQLLKIVTTQPAPAPSAVTRGIVPELDAICLSALAKEPAKRHDGSMRVFADALQSFLESPAFSETKVGATNIAAVASESTIIQSPGWLPSTQSEQP